MKKRDQGLVLNPGPFAGLNFHFRVLINRQDLVLLLPFPSSQSNTCSPEDDLCCLRFPLECALRKCSASRREWKMRGCKAGFN